MNKPRVLILGSSGMLGRVVFSYLMEKYSNSIIGTDRKKNNDQVVKFDFNNLKSLENLLKQAENVDFIINCIGVLKSDQKTNYSINYTLPRYLEKLQKKYNFKLIQISTDDVFKPSAKKVDEMDTPRPESNYGKSKLKGETNSKNSLTIRTSTIGFDPIKRRGLIEWIVQSKNKTINGYINQSWSGCTTLQFAKLCDFLIFENNFKRFRTRSAVVHFAPLGPITKYDLIKTISKELKLKNKIINKQSDSEITRFLASRYFDKKMLARYTTEVNSALKELIKFENETLKAQKT